MLMIQSSHIQFKGTTTNLLLDIRKSTVAFKMRVLVILFKLLLPERRVSVTWRSLFVIMFLSMLPMIFRKVDLSFEKLGLKKVMSWRFNIVPTAIGEMNRHESWKQCSNLCSRRWRKPNLNLVNNLTRFELWQLKTVLPEGRMKFKSVFLEMFKLSELQIFMSSLLHSITAEGKKEFRKKLWFTLNRGILLVFLVLYVLTKVGIILNRCFGHLYEKLEKATQYHPLFFSGVQT